MFISYFMYGDFFNNYYKNLTFIFLKVLQSFFRGTIDNKDYHSAIVASKISDISPYFNQYTDLVDKTGHYYILFAILFLFLYFHSRMCYWFLLFNL